MKPYDQMQPHQQRVVKECHEMTEGAERLDLFMASEVYHALPIADRLSLDRHRTYMQLYINVLKKLINAF